MNGRLRVVLIEAEGESARAAIDAAMKVFTPQGFAALPDPAPVEPAALPMPAPSAQPRGGRQPRAAKRNAKRGPRQAPAPAAGNTSAAPSAAAVTYNGVTVDSVAGAERVMFKAAVVSISADGAVLAAALARTMPVPVDRAFLRQRHGLKGEWAEQLLNQRAARLREQLAPIGLNVETVRGVGIKLEAVE